MAVRDKQRYVLVETSIENGMRQKKQLETQFYQDLAMMLGLINYHKVNPRVIRYIDDTRFIIRLRNELPSLITALALMREFNSKRVAFYTLKSSGTIAALMKPNSN